MCCSTFALPQRQGCRVRGSSGTCQQQQPGAVRIKLRTSRREISASSRSPILVFGPLVSELLVRTKPLRGKGCRVCTCKRRVSQFDFCGQRHALCCDLATMGPVKYTPQGEISRNVFELMLDPRGHKQEVARLE